MDLFDIVSKGTSDFVTLLLQPNIDCFPMSSKMLKNIFPKGRKLPNYQAYSIETRLRSQWNVPWDVISQPLYFVYFWGILFLASRNICFQFQIGTQGIFFPVPFTSLLWKYLATGSTTQKTHIRGCQRYPQIWNIVLKDE